MSDKPDIKIQLATFSVKYQEIQAAKAALAQLEDEASQVGDAIMKAHGKGPHNLIVPDPKDHTKRRAIVVVFQRVAKAVRFESTDVTDLVADLAAPMAAPVPASPPAPVDDPLARVKAATA